MSRGSVQIWRQIGHREERAAHLLGFALMVFAIGMALVAVVALARSEQGPALAFFASAFGSAVAGSAALVVPSRAVARFARPGLLVLMLIYAVGPAVAAIPVLASMPGLTPLQAYFEMVSALTTTGASIMRGTALVPDAILLWRSVVAGFGGFLCLVAALAIMAPLSIGGFEVEHRIEIAQTSSDSSFLAPSEGFRQRGVEGRTIWAARLLVLPYLTVCLLGWLVLTASGLDPFEAACLTLSTISTTGFAPHDGGIASYGSKPIEFILLLIMVLGAIGVTKHVRALRGRPSTYLEDPELRYMGWAVGLVVAAIFLRHWVGAIETRSGDELEAGINALWGVIFTSVSFITTTGFESADWKGATAWSGLETAGVALIGLAVVGGGAASTAGGVKLLRAALLAKHSYAEMTRLARPSAVLTLRSAGRPVSMSALRIVFVFAMLFALALAMVALGLAACGIPMIQSILAAISAVSNAGPLLPVVTGDPLAYADFPPVAKLILGAAMVVGRMETLAVVAVLSPAVWRS